MDTRNDCPLKVMVWVYASTVIKTRRAKHKMHNKQLLLKCSATVYLAISQSVIGQVHWLQSCIFLFPHSCTSSFLSCHCQMFWFLFVSFFCFVCFSFKLLQPGTSTDWFCYCCNNVIYYSPSCLLWSARLPACLFLKAYSKNYWHSITFENFHS